MNNEPWALWSRYLKDEQRAYHLPDCQVGLNACIFNLPISFAAQLRLLQQIIHNPHVGGVIVDWKEKENE